MTFKDMLEAQDQWLAEQLELEPRLDIDGVPVKDWLALLHNPAWKHLELFLSDSLCLTMAELRKQPAEQVAGLQGQARVLAGLLDIVVKAAQYCADSQGAQSTETAGLGNKGDGA